jgi:hypothetical protein
METKLVISGAEILQRWGAVPFHLREAMFSGDLVPVSAWSGEKRTQERDPCLYCKMTDKEVIKHNGKFIVLCDDGTSYFENTSPKPTFFMYCPHSDNWAESHHERLMSAAFLLEDVEAYEMKHGNTGNKSPEDIIQRCHEKNITDPHDIARILDDTFTGDRALSHLELGRLLPADPNITISTSAQRDRGKRLRGLKK